MSQQRSTRWGDILLFSLRWHNRLLLGVVGTTSLFVIIIALRTLSRRRYRSPTIEDGISGDEKNDFLDSSFSTYLGHNALTESSPYDPSNTSHQVIQCLQDQSLYEYLEAALSDELRPGEFTPNQNTLAPGSCQHFSYPDSSTQQMSFDTIHSMHNDYDLRTWQRRTRQIYGV